MKKAIKQLFQKKVSELTVEELVNTIQCAIEDVVRPRPKGVPADFASYDEELYHMLEEYPENYLIGMNALSRTIGCSVRKAYLLKNTGVFDEAIYRCGRKLVFNKAMVLDAYSRNGMFLKGKRLQDKILEYKATAL